MAPVRTVRGEGNVGAAEAEPLSADELWTIGEDVIVSFENESSELSGGDDDGGNLAELQVEYGTELVSELGEGVVGHVCEEVKVTDYGESWPR